MWALIDQLIQQGVEDFFIGSGSRSTPLVMAAARHPKAKIHRHLDERGLGFFALGCALAKETPVAIIVTSGTAVGNLLPAVMEAHHASIPLILLTADRPPELREAESNQTTDQIRMFQNFVRWQFDLDSQMGEAAIRSKGAQAVFRSLSSPGPVQINCPLREPLYRQTEMVQGKKIGVEIGIKSVAASHPLPSKGLILIGKLPKRSDLAPILKLGKQLQWPIFADLLSNGRLSPTKEQIRRFDWIIEKPDAPRPECILHFGDRFVSKRVLDWLKKSPPARYYHISPHQHWYDPNQLVTDRIDSNEAHFSNSIDPEWLQNWLESDRNVEEHLDSLFEQSSFSESQAIRTLSQLPLDKTAIFLGASMPVREADWFLFPKKAKGFFSNRGLSGIDGNIATAAGIAEGLQAPVLAIVGDLTALHDLNSLSLVKQSPYPITLLISNNGGGGIFSHLPISQEKKFEELFAFQHDIHFEKGAEMFQLPYFRVENLETLAKALEHKGSCVIEMINSRIENIAFHKWLKKECISYSCTAS